MNVDLMDSRALHVEDGRAPETVARPGVMSLDAAHAKIAQLEVAVEHRTVIGQATGIIMERSGLDAHGAFSILVRLSQGQNRKLYAIAVEIAQRREVDG